MEKPNPSESGWAFWSLTYGRDINSVAAVARRI
jgi:hypothetical protein